MPMCEGSSAAAVIAAPAAFYVRPMGTGTAPPPMVEVAVYAGPDPDNLRPAGTLTLHPAELAELSRRTNRPTRPPALQAQCGHCGRWWGLTRLPAVGWRCPRSLGGCGTYQKITRAERTSSNGQPHRAVR